GSERLPCIIASHAARARGSRRQSSTSHISLAWPFNASWRKGLAAKAKLTWRKRNVSVIREVGHGRLLRAKSGTGRRRRIASLVSIRNPDRHDSKHFLSAFVRRTRSESGTCSKTRFATKRTSKQITVLFARAALSGTSTRSVI